jgi:hypothetical protein
MALWDKIKAVATGIYGAADITASAKVRAQIDELDARWGHLPVCIAKTQMSFSTDPRALGAPSGHTVDLNEVRLAAGAGFVVVVAGGLMTMPGLPKVPAAEHIDLYYRTIGLGANLMINLPPDQRGLIPDDLVAAAKNLGDEIQRRFAHPIAELKTIPAGDMVELIWEKPTRIDTVVLMENIANGQKIASYTLEAQVDGQWTELKPANKFIPYKPPYNVEPGFETIGRKKIDRIEPVTTSHIRFRCLKSVAQPVELRRLAAFDCASDDGK